MKAIMEMCEIPRRTAFRYLNDLSEANVPVYFDETIRAYRLVSRHRLVQSELSVGEVALILIALRRLGASLTDMYLQTLREIEGKLVISHESMTGAVTDALTSIPSTVGSGDSTVEDITSAMIHLGIALAPKTRLAIMGPDQSRLRTVESPSIRFDRDWFLVGKVHHGRIVLRLGDIQFAALR
jgi:hypothetical protein